VSSQQQAEDTARSLARAQADRCQSGLAGRSEAAKRVVAPLLSGGCCVLRGLIYKCSVAIARRTLVLKQSIRGLAAAQMVSASTVCCNTKRRKHTSHASPRLQLTIVLTYNTLYIRTKRYPAAARTDLAGDSLNCTNTVEAAAAPVQPLGELKCLL